VQYPTRSFKTNVFCSLLSFPPLIFFILSLNVSYTIDSILYFFHNVCIVISLYMCFIMQLGRAVTNVVITCGLIHLFYFIYQHWCLPLTTRYSREGGPNSYMYIVLQKCTTTKCQHS